MSLFLFFNLFNLNYFFVFKSLSLSYIKGKVSEALVFFWGGWGMNEGRTGGKNIGKRGAVVAAGKFSKIR